MTRVVFFMLDGVRPDAFGQAACPNLSALMARGATSLQASSVLPCITLPCHTTIFHSVPPGRHGITTNEWHPMARPVPGLVDMISRNSMRAAFFFNWEPLRDLSRPGSLNFAYFRDSHLAEDGDDTTAAEAARFISRDQPDFAFVYFGTVDVAGHDWGWMSARYLAQLERVDAAVATVLAALPAETAVLVQADHGGHDRDHGLDIPEDMTIPWFVAGPGVRKGHRIQGAVRLIDTAPTIARLLGIEPHPDWEGACIEEIFDGDGPSSEAAPDAA